MRSSKIRLPLEQTATDQVIVFSASRGASGRYGGRCGQLGTATRTTRRRWPGWLAAVSAWPSDEAITNGHTVAVESRVQPVPLVTEDFGSFESTL